MISSHTKRAASSIHAGFGILAWGLRDLALHWPFALFFWASIVASVCSFIENSYNIEECYHLYAMGWYEEAIFSNFKEALDDLGRELAVRREAHPDAQLRFSRWLHSHCLGIANKLDAFKRDRLGASWRYKFAHLIWLCQKGIDRNELVESTQIMEFRIRRPVEDEDGPEHAVLLEWL